MTWVLDQVMRIMLHGRMQYGLERYRREHPEVDILLIEPTRDDVRMFGYNIMRYSARRVVAEHGYRTALAFFRHHSERYRRLFAKHGIAMARSPADPRHPVAPPAPVQPRPGPRLLARPARVARSAAAARPARPSAEPDRAPARQAAVDHPLDRGADLLARSG